jgi:hypothetical protein
MAKIKEDDKVMKMGDDGIEETVVKVVRKQNTLITQIDTDPKVIIESIKEGKEIVFNPKDLPEIEKEQLNDFPYKIVQEYLKAKAKRDEIAKEGHLEVLGSLNSNSGRKLQLRFRRGYHQTWKRPDQIDDAKYAGYVFIRDPGTKDGKELKEEPGKETGEIKKIGYRDKPELMAMEIPLYRKEAHNLAVSKKSKRAYSSNKDGFISAVEEVNSRLKGSDKLAIVDDERG